MRNRHFGLDAIRAAAVLAVVASHGIGLANGLDGRAAPGWAGAMGGWGVQAFFALSGLLIGRVRLGLGERPTMAGWAAFMGRRWARTLPLYWCVLAALAALTPPSADVGSHLLRWATFTQNVASDLLDEWFPVSWSLAVEEVFYLLAGAALPAACARWGQRAAWPVVGTFLATPLLARLLLAALGVGYGYQAALLSLDAIAYGVALALLERRGAPWLFGRPLAAAVTGLVLLFAAWWSYLVPGATGTWLPGSPCLAEAGCCGLLVAALRLRSAPAWLARPVQAFAAHSYSIYLVHLPILVLAVPAVAAGTPLPLAGALALAGVAAAAHAGHALVEVPGMRLHLRQHAQSAARVGAVATT